VARVVVTIVLVLAGIYIVLGTTLLKVKDVIIDGAEGSIAQDIKKNLQLQLNENLFSGNLFSLNTKQIEQTAQKQNPLIESIHIRLSIPLRLVAVVQLQHAQLRWRSGVENFAVSDDGRAFRTVTQDDGQFAQVVDNSNIPIHEGQQVASGQFVKFVREINSEMPAISGPISNYDIYDTTFELSAVTSNGYRIKFDTTRSSQDQLHDLKAVLDLAKRQNKKINEYVDVRIAGRAFYK
jgi:cell division septal protein FtsQ